MEKREEFRLKDGRVVLVKRLRVADFEKGDNYAFYHEWLHGVSEYLTRSFPIENLERDRKQYYEVISDEEHRIVLGATHHGRIVARTHVELKPEGHKCRHVGTWGIAIHPDFHGQGLGKRLLEEIERIARSLGVEKLQASYDSRNERARRLYLDVMGYEVEGRQKRAIIGSNGERADEVLIGKFLEGEPEGATKSGLP